MLAAELTFAPLRDSLLADAESRAASMRGDAAARAAAEVAAARADVEALVARECTEAQRQADLEALRRSSAHRRAAQSRVLRARREAFESLRQEALSAALRFRGEPAYQALLDRLEEDARARIGSDASVERDPAGVGGVVARAGKRVIDATLPALVGQALEELGEEVETLWA